MLQLLYDLLPLPVFLVVIAIPAAWVYVSTKMKHRTDEFSRRYRKNISDGLMQQLEQEESDKATSKDKKKVRLRLHSRQEGDRRGG